MNRRIVLAGAVVALLPVPALAAEAAPAAPISAIEAIARERELATLENKRLMLVFFASWCGICRYFDRLLYDRAAAPIFNAYFRIYHLRVMETSAAMSARQLRGAADIYRTVAPSSSGVPFVAFEDEQGHMVASSYVMGQNVGYPTEPDELEGFATMLRAAAPAITDAELATLREACIRLAPRD